MKPRNIWILAGAVVALAAGGFALLQGTTASAEGAEIHVIKSPTCGCCADWAEHLREAGFEVTVEDRNDLTARKRELGVPSDLSSCHTATVGGYVVEGHVPASDIRRLLEERPDVEGIAVPGMPMGSPGMEGPRKDPYRVIAFDGRGARTVWANH